MDTELGTAHGLELDQDSAAREASAKSAWIGLLCLAVAGLALFWCQFASLFRLWTTDSLRSIGILVIPTSVVLGIRALRREDFDKNGSWWGMALVSLALAGAILPHYGSLNLVWGASSEVDLTTPGVLLCLYASGVVLLLGGRTAWRKARFPLFLLLFVNPVPSLFTKLIDLPLQHLGAETARSLASVLGVPVSGAALNLMFYHGSLGMFIAPGCNGLHGAVAMGLLALVIGYIRRLRPLRLALFAAAAILLAYVFNLLRLCTLVLYYCLAHLFPILGSYAVGADYVIGGALFIVAALFLLLPGKWSFPEG